MKVRLRAVGECPQLALCRGRALRECPGWVACGHSIERPGYWLIGGLRRRWTALSTFDDSSNLHRTSRILFTRARRSPRRMKPFGSRHRQAGIQYPRQCDDVEHGELGNRLESVTVACP